MLICVLDNIAYRYDTIRLLFVLLLLLLDVTKVSVMYVILTKDLGLGQGFPVNDFRSKHAQNTQHGETSTLLSNLCKR
jgi:hypothetical protein